MNWKKIKKPDPFDVALWGFAVTFLIAVVYFFQLRAMLESNEINRESLQSVQRAYISRKAISQEIITEHTASDKNRVLKFEAHFENTGNTPALQIDSYVGGGIIATPTYITQEQFIGKQHNPVRSVIGPHSPLILGETSVPLSFFSVEKIVPGQPQQFSSKTFGIWGWVIYRDAFPKTKIHVTEFCEVVTNIIANHPLFPISIRATLKDCPVHNCADEQCDDYKELVEAVTASRPTPAP